MIWPQRCFGGIRVIEKRSSCGAKPKPPRFWSQAEEDDYKRWRRGFTLWVLIVMILIGLNFSAWTR